MIAIAREYQKRLSRERGDDILVDLSARYDRDTRTIQRYISRGNKLSAESMKTKREVPVETRIEQRPYEETPHKQTMRELANPKLESVQILETDNLRFGLEVLVDNTNSSVDVWIKEILLGGRETQIQVGRTPFLVRAIFRVTMDCALREGVTIIAGRAEEDGADWGAYRLQGTFKHINGTPKRTLEFSLSFKPVLTVPAGEKLPIVLIFKPATKKLVKIHRQGKSAGSYIGEFIEKRFWLEIHTNVGVLKYEMEDDSFLKFLASQGVELTLKP